MVIMMVKIIYTFKLYITFFAYSLFNDMISVANLSITLYHYFIIYLKYFLWSHKTEHCVCQKFKNYIRCKIIIIQNGRS